MASSNIQTVFVVGAGASREVDLPVGRTLADQIAGMCRYSRNSYGDIEGGDKEFLRQIHRSHSPDLSEFIATANAISNGVVLTPSIDQFIDKRPDEPRIAILGKAAIVASILNAERQSLLAVNESERRRMNLIRLRKSWFWGLGALLTARIDKPHRGDLFRDVAIVCFNYDRCIEQFLAYYLMDLYEVTLAEARELVHTLTILRPYGSVAPIYGGNDAVFYGADWEQLDVFRLARNIRTFTERNEDGDTLARIREVVQNANLLAFLGFHYLEQNMTILTPQAPVAAARVFGTAFERSGYEVVELAGRVRGMLLGSGPNKRVRSAEPIIVPMTCGQLFAEYGIGLELS